ncbi:MAG: rod shape-determining protein MreC [Lachnospiraceae bacterium]|nr:rod shape-determining protein MreC [Lachnospiraceae bacterium]
MDSAKRKKKIELNLHIPDRYLLLLVTVLCLGMILISYATNLFAGPLNLISNYLIVPFQDGVSAVGTWMVSETEMMKQISELLDENERLKAQNEELIAENTRIQQDKYELDELRALYQLDQAYAEYEKTGARVIARDAGNWYHSFIIDKGTEDGIATDMNVIAGSGLVGRITSVGPDWARVESIIDDGSNVTANVLSTSDQLIVSGDLTLYEKGLIRFSRLTDSQEKVSVGDKVVTSNISDKYLPGILIGYISEINKDANRLTSSGTLTPAVSFDRLNNVLVILERKQTVE